jgi:hypothetical protein
VCGPASFEVDRENVRWPVQDISEDGSDRLKPQPIMKPKTADNSIHIGMKSADCSIMRRAPLVL